MATTTMQRVLTASWTLWRMDTMKEVTDVRTRQQLDEQLCRYARLRYYKYSPQEQQLIEQLPGFRWAPTGKDVAAHQVAKPANKVAPKPAFGSGCFGWFVGGTVCVVGGIMLWNYCYR